MEKIEATFRIVTPMFVSGADREIAELRTASIKGMLRFWWRALNWGEYIKNIGNEFEALKTMRRDEGDLFGGAEGNNKNSSKFIMKVERLENPNFEIDWPSGENDPSSYLGMGIWESGEIEKGNYQAHRVGFRENQNFTLSLFFKNNFCAKKISSIKDALKIMGLIGGLGGRSRRAFGSLAIEKIDGENICVGCVGEYERVIYSVLEKYTLSNFAPPFTAFSKNTRLSVSKKLDKSARLSHLELGSAYKKFRSDNTGERKKVFGLPLEGATSRLAEARRASPIMFHIHPIGNKFIFVASLFPALFHEDPSLQDVDFSLIGKFMDEHMKQVAVI